MLGKSSKSKTALPSAKVSAVNSSVSSVAGANKPGGATLYEVVIAGVPMRLKSTHEMKVVSELVALVDSKIREALPLTKTGSVQNAAILAALHLAEEYLMLRRKAKAELEKLEARTSKLVSEMESSRLLGHQDKRTHASDDKGSQSADGGMLSEQSLDLASHEEQGGREFSH